MIVLEFAALFLALVALYVAIIGAMLLAWAIVYGIMRVAVNAWTYLTNDQYRAWVNGKVRRRFRAGKTKTKRAFHVKSAVKVATAA